MQVYSISTDKYIYKFSISFPNHTLQIVYVIQAIIYSKCLIVDKCTMTLPTSVPCPIISYMPYLVAFLLFPGMLF